MTIYHDKSIFRVIMRNIDYVYEKVFHEKINHTELNFINNIYYIATGTIIATIFSFTFNILAGRWLGPLEYGKYTLVNTIAMFLYIPMLLGISTGMVKYNSEKIDLDRQKKIISTSYILIFTFSLITLTIYSIFSSKIIQLLSIPSNLYWYSVAFAVIFVYRTQTTETIRSLRKMRILAILSPFQAILLLISFLFFVYLDTFSFKAMIYSTYISYTVVSVLIILYIHKYLKLEFNREWARKLIRYSSFTVLSSMSYMLYTNIDKILISTYMTVTDVGIYNAYTYASINVLDLLTGIFITVLFPTISGSQYKKSILRKVNKFVPCLILVGIPISITTELIILSIYGEKYPMNYLLISTFAITSVLSSWYRIYAWLLNSEGENGVKLTMRGTGSIAVINILLNICLIPQIGLLGAIMSTAIAYCIGIYIIYNQKETVLG